MEENTGPIDTSRRPAAARARAATAVAAVALLLSVVLVGWALRHAHDAWARRAVAELVEALARRHVVPQGGEGPRSRVRPEVPLTASVRPRAHFGPLSIESLDPRFQVRVERGELAFPWLAGTPFFAEADRACTLTVSGVDLGLSPRPRLTLEEIGWVASGKSALLPAIRALGSAGRMDVVDLFIEGGTVEAEFGDARPVRIRALNLHLPSTGVGFRAEGEFITAGRTAGSFRIPAPGSRAPGGDRGADLGDGRTSRRDRATWLPTLALSSVPVDLIARELLPGPALALAGGRFELAGGIERDDQGARLAGGGRFSDVEFLIDSRKLPVTLAGEFRLENRTLVLEPPGTLSGRIDLRHDELHLEITDREGDIGEHLGFLAPALAELGPYQLTGRSRLFMILTGDRRAPRTVLDVRFSSALLSGSAGFPNLTNLTGSVAGEPDRIRLPRVQGTLGSGTLDASAEISGSAGSQEVRAEIGFRGLSIDDVEPFLTRLPRWLRGAPLDPLPSETSAPWHVVTRGRISGTATLAGPLASPTLGVRGSLDSGALDLVPGTFRLEPFSGRFHLTGDRLNVESGTGFFGDLPVEVSGSERLGPNGEFDFELEFRDIPLENLSTGQSPVFSRLSFRSPSTLRLRVRSEGKGRVESELVGTLRDGEFGLLPLPFRATLGALGIRARLGTGPGRSDPDRTSAHTAGWRTARVGQGSAVPTGPIRLGFLLPARLVGALAIAGEAGGSFELENPDTGSVRVRGDLAVLGPHLVFTDADFFERRLAMQDLSAAISFKEGTLAVEGGFGIASGRGSFKLLANYGAGPANYGFSLALSSVDLAAFANLIGSGVARASGVLALRFFGGWAPGGPPRYQGEFEIRNAGLPGDLRFDRLSGRFTLAAAMLTIESLSEEGGTASARALLEAFPRVHLLAPIAPDPAAVRILGQAEERLRALRNVFVRRLPRRWPRFTLPLRDLLD